MYLLFLGIAAIDSWWYPWRALVSLGSYGGAGFFNGGGYEVYIFTYVGAALSLVLVTFFVMKHLSREEWYLAALVGYVTSVVTIGWYEQVWSGLGLVFDSSSFQWWYASHSTGDQVIGTIGGLLSILLIYPFVSKRGLRLSIPLWIACGAAFVVWIAIGYQLPDNSPMAWGLNAITRVSSQLIPVALVFPRSTRRP